MTRALLPHVAFFYTGIPSYAAALRLGQRYGRKVGFRRTSQGRILDDLEALHEEWQAAGCKWLETVTVLGALVPRDLEEERKAHPGKLEGMLEAMTSAGVRVFLLNEYKPFESRTWAGAVLRGELIPSKSGLVEAVEELHGPGAPPDPFALSGLGKGDGRTDSLLPAMDWLDVELKQFPDEAGLLTEFVHDLSGAGELPPLWKARAGIQARRGKAILAGRIYERVVKEAMKVADSNIPVLILGPSGSGKEALAKRIHFASSRAGEPVLIESCANFPDSLIESELFGTCAGAFTGATDRPGLLKEADGGTLFLDELGELSRPAQGKLLRFLQEGTFRPVGGRMDVKVDVRLVAATNEDIYARVREGTFRADLWYRLAGAVLETPSLCGHPDSDSSIRRIAGHQAVVLFDEDPKLRLARLQAGHPLRLEEGQFAALLEYGWPGNVRELRQAVHRHLVTGLPMSRIVEELRRREEEWHARRPASAEGAFVVHDLRDVVELGEDYCLWAQRGNPGKTQKELGASLGLSEKTLREKIQRALAREA